MKTIVYSSDDEERNFFSEIAIHRKLSNRKLIEDEAEFFQRKNFDGNADENDDLADGRHSTPALLSANSSPARVHFANETPELIIRQGWSFPCTTILLNRSSVESYHSFVAFLHFHPKNFIWGLVILPFLAYSHIFAGFAEFLTELTSCPNFLGLNSMFPPWVHSQSSLFQIVIPLNICVVGKPEHAPFPCPITGLSLVIGASV